MESAIIIPSVLPESTKKTKDRTDGRLYRNLNNFDTNFFMEDMCRPRCSWADVKKTVLLNRRKSSGMEHTI